MCLEKKEKRQDIRTLFIDELGFKEVYGTNDIPTAQLASFAIELKKQERKYHAINNASVSFFAFNNDEGIKGVTVRQQDGKFYLGINKKAHANIKDRVWNIRFEQVQGKKVKSDGRITKNYTQTARHEYGHLLEFQVVNKTGKSEERIKNEINNIARMTYNSKKDYPSLYGDTTAKEFFAESFASMTGGNPNAHGRALESWLRQNYR